MVTVENVHTGVKSTFTDAEWADVQGKKMWADTFKVLSAGEQEQKKIEVPKEVADLQAGKTTQTQGAADVDNTEAPEAKADKPAAAKQKAGNGKQNKPTN